MTAGPAPVPPALARRSSDEYAPLPWRVADRRALARIGRAVAAASRASLDPRAWIASRLGTAATLRAVDAEAGGGFWTIPPEAEVDPEAAAAAFAGDEIVVDVQTHLVRPSRLDTASGRALLGFLALVDPDRWSGGLDPQLLAAPMWAASVFGGSETSVALLTSTPGRADENVLTNTDIAVVREIVDRYGPAGRVLTHTIVHPNLGAPELDAMVTWRDELRPSGWKVYTLWAPSESSGKGWFLDDTETGLPFLERVRALGPRIVCAHKGIAGPVPQLAPAASSPRDVGPAAAAFPDIDFVVYHSGYDPDPAGEEGAHAADPTRGVSRLVTSLADAGIGRGANVYAELGSTWFLMLRRPREAAHVLGKLLLAMGEDRILWGTDSIWYGPPQFLVDAFRAFTIPGWMQAEYGYPALTRGAKESILGTNAARLYGVDLTAARSARTAPETLDALRAELGERLP